MMRFECGECGQRFSTTDDPAPGHVYGVPCRCGTTIIVQMDARARARPPPLPGRRSTPAQSLSAATDDPFAQTTMDAPSQESHAPRTRSIVPPRLALREPTNERDEAPESSGWRAFDEALPETTRAKWLSGTRAMLLDGTAAVREVVGAGARHLLRYRRLVAGGAMLGAVAFGLGVWVGAASMASRWKAKTAAAVAEAEARPLSPATSMTTVAALGPVEVPVAVGAPAAMAARTVTPSRPTPASRSEPTRRGGPPHAEPARARPAATAEPRAPAEPATIEVKAAEAPTPARDPARGEEPATTADRMPAASDAAVVAGPSGRRDAPANEPTLTASLNPAPEADAATNQKPADPKPTEPLPGK